MNILTPFKRSVLGFSTTKWTAVFKVLVPPYDVAWSVALRYSRTSAYPHRPSSLSLQSPFSRTSKKNTC